MNYVKKIKIMKLKFHKIKNLFMTYNNKFNK